MLFNNCSRSAALALVLGVSASGNALADVNVVVSSKPIHALVASVMNGVGTADVLVSGTASPHSYAMKPSDAKKANTADVFFRVSESLEPFTGKLVSSLPKSVKVISLSEAPGVTLLQRRSGGAFEDHDDHGRDHGHKHGKKAKNEHDHDHDHDHDEDDPHVWLDPENAKAMVRHIAAVLAEAAPDKAAQIKANAGAEIGRLDALDTELEQQLKPLADKPFVVYHDAYQYLEKRYGLQAVGSLTVNPDVAPSGRRLRDLRRKITETKAECVFAEPQFEARITNLIADGTKARTGTLDPEGTSLKPGPDLYHTLMRNLAEGLKGCLAKGA